MTSTIPTKYYGLWTEGDSPPSWYLSNSTWNIVHIENIINPTLTSTVNKVSCWTFRIISKTIYISLPDIVTRYSLIQSLVFQQWQSAFASSTIFNTSLQNRVSYWICECYLHASDTWHSVHWRHRDESTLVVMTAAYGASPNFSITRHCNFMHHTLHVVKPVGELRGYR